MSLEQVVLQHKDNGTQLNVRISPGAKKNAVTGTWLDAVRISIAAPPRKGKANKALCAFCARLFDIPRKKVQIVRGEKSRDKTLLLEEQDPAKIRSLLADVIGDEPRTGSAD